MAFVSKEWLRFGLIGSLIFGGIFVTSCDKKTDSKSSSSVKVTFNPLSGQSVSSNITATINDFTPICANVNGSMLDTRLGVCLFTVDDQRANMLDGGSLLCNVANTVAELTLTLAVEDICEGTGITNFDVFVVCGPNLISGTALVTSSANYTCP